MSFFQHLGTFLRSSIYSLTETTTITSTTCATTPLNDQVTRSPLTPSSSCTSVPLDRTGKHQEEQIPTYMGLERYTLLEKLGDGAFSDVYKALDQKTQEKVAIKIIRKLEMNTGQRSRVLREVQLMRSLQHDSIISLYDFMETNNFYFLILELCEGGELFHQIVHLTYFSEDLARHCIWQVAEAIRYLHEEKGVVHRDIKPENLLFSPIPFIENRGDRTQPLQPQDDDEDEPKVDEGGFIPNYGGGGIGKVKLADFGLSKVIWNEQTKTPCGTLAYTAPELLRNERYSRSVDMWALGCVLYTMLCGFPPFYDDAVDVLTEQVARGQYEFLSPWWDFISDGAKDLITHVLCLDPNERYDIHQFMQHPWMTNQVPSLNDSPLNITGPLILPPSTTTSIAKENIAATRSRHMTYRDPCDQFTTSVSSMKEIINISYQVHRQSEERVLRKQHQKWRCLFDYSLKTSILGKNTDSDIDGDIEYEDGDDDDDSDYDYIDNTPRDSLILLSNGPSATEKRHYEQQQQQPFDENIPNSSNSNSGTFDLDIGSSSDEITLVPTLLSMPTTPTTKEAAQKPKKRHHRSKKTPLFDLDLDKASLIQRRRKSHPCFAINLTAGSVELD